METVVTYRGQTIGAEEIELIQRISDEHWDRGRTAISQEICRQWDWRQPNGHPKEIVCRGLLLKLERAGRIRLPPRKRKGIYRGRKLRIPSLPVDTCPIQGSLNDLLPLDWIQVRGRGSQEALFNSLIARYHYLGYCQTVGEHLKYLVVAHGRPIACLAWGSAAWKVACRDRFIGWTHPVRQRNLYRVVNNTRFLILPFVRVANLASHLLSQNIRRLPEDWHSLYAHRPVLLETFVQHPFPGTCYKAANWLHVGITQGRGKYDVHNRSGQPVKAVFLYPLHKQFQRILCHG